MIREHGARAVRPSVFIAFIAVCVSLLFALVASAHEIGKTGFTIEFHDLPDYEHNTIYSRGDTVVRQAWEFLKTKVLDDEPRYQVYSYQKERGAPGVPSTVGSAWMP